jgi:single-strand DNA-binding protein
MITVTCTGRVTADIAAQKSPKGTDYVKFNLAVNKGFGENQKAVFLQCLLFGEPQVQRMVKAKVQKGSLISVIGDLDVEEYEKKDGTKDKTVKVTLYDWNYVPQSGKTKDENASPTNGEAANADDLPF